MDRVTRQLPERTTFFITPLTDVEHQFCKPEHLASVYSIPIEVATRIVNGAIAKMTARLAALFSNKRQNAKDRILRQKEDVPGAQELLAAELPFEYAKGKLLFGQVVQDLNAEHLNGNRLSLTLSDALSIPTLRAFADRAWAVKE